MKPSERIYQIWEELCKAKGLELDSLGSMPYHPYAIAKYLDENQPCEHRSSYQVDSLVGNVFYNVCNDCGVLFLAKK